MVTPENRESSSKRGMKNSELIPANPYFSHSMTFKFYLFIHAQFSNKLGKQVVQGPFVLFIFSIQICSKHQNDLEVNREIKRESQVPREQLEIQGFQKKSQPS